MGRPRVVLADANVLYSRVLRDYLMYAAIDGVMTLKWSDEILREMSRNLILNGRVTGSQADRLLDGMNRALRFASVLPTRESYALIQDLSLPHDQDRHVVAAAIAANADYLCTDNMADFPASVMRRAGVWTITADRLLTMMLRSRPDQMWEVHGRVVSSIRGGSDQASVQALRNANCDQAAERLVEVIRTRGASRPRTPPTIVIRPLTAAEEAGGQAIRCGSTDTRTGRPCRRLVRSRPCPYHGAKLRVVV